MSAFRVSLALVLLAGLTACSQEDTPLLVVEDIAARRAQFVQLQLGADMSHLSDGDRIALDHLLKAADIMDVIFDRQVWAGNAEMSGRIAGYDGPNAAAFKDYYRINKGPWDRLTDMEPFVDEIEHPDGAGFYPEDMTAEDFEQWIEAHPEDEEAFQSLHTMIVRGDDGGLKAVPYSEFFAEELRYAAAELSLAADATTDPTLATFLRSRAEAFLTDDYFQSDMDWMDLAGDFEVVIGPYETYEDLLFGYKASFETFICVVNPQDSEALSIYKDQLPYMESNLPIEDEYKNLDRGSESPIRVADEIYTAGDTRAGVQTLAFNLPNDERVREAKGSKKVMLKNMIRAKFDAVLTPISQVALPPGERGHLNFDSYFNYILFHELSHGLGPGQITLAGRETEVRLELKEFYSAFEEAKADIVGMFNLYALFDKGIIDGEIINDLPWTATAGLFRSVRFGVGSAHGQGVAMEMNYLLQHGAIEVTDEGHFRPVPDYFRAGVRDLAHDLLMIEALGDYEAAEAFHAKYMRMTPQMDAIIDKMEDIPVDVDPVYAVGGEGSDH